MRRSRFWSRGTGRIVTEDRKNRLYVIQMNYIESHFYNKSSPGVLPDALWGTYVHCL